ncbi:MAG: DUF5701 family protein, partial [Patescibacteria group bacterium]
KKIPLMEVDGKRGFTTLDLSEFKTAEGVEIPESLAYLIVDVENGKAMLGITPDKAIKQFKKEERSPLTAEEGVAIVTQYPEILKDHDLSLLGSVFEIDDGFGIALLRKRAALEAVLELDWYFSDSSHAKWGSASCGERVGV